MMPVCTSNQCPDNRAWITHRTTPAAAAHTSPAVTMGRHFIITHHPEWIRVLSRSLLRFLLAGARTGWPGWAPAPPVLVIRPLSAARTMAARTGPVGAAGAAGRPA